MTRTASHLDDAAGVIAAAEVRRVMAERGIDSDALMLEVRGRAAERARAPISNFFVGAVARGATTGNLYYGANLEFPGAGLGATVHAEQAAVVNAWVGGEKGIDRIAVSAAPCGHCRQFLNEISDGIEIMTGEIERVASLLPHAFGPRSLGAEEPLMSHAAVQLEIETDDELSSAALQAAAISYAPYSGERAGVALRLHDGRIYSAPYAENAAFNPSLPPLQGALVLMSLAGASYEDITDAVLVATGDLHTAQTKMVLESIGVESLRVIHARNSSPSPGR